MHHPAPPGEVLITDHAVLRYLERYCGVDIESVKRWILAGGRGELVRKMRSGRFPIDAGAKLVAKDGVIITIVLRNQK